jgi:hypothetical protein
MTEPKQEPENKVDKEEQKRLDQEQKDREERDKNPAGNFLGGTPPPK